MELTGLKDLDREILKYIPDKELLRVCRISRRFWYDVCDDAFLKRRLGIYPNIHQNKDENENWKQFFLRMTNIMFQMKRKYKFSYSGGNIIKQLELLGKYKLRKLLYEAAGEGELSLVKHAVSKGINIHHKEDRALLYAGEGGHLEVVKYLVENGADVNGYDANILGIICENGKYEVARYLIEKGATVDAVGNYAMRETCAEGGEGSLEMVKFLIEKGAEIDGFSFCRSAYCGHLDITKYLLSMGADIHYENERTLKETVEYGSAEMVKFLVENGADPHIDDDVCLILACENGKIDTMDYLISIGLDIHMRDEILLSVAIKRYICKGIGRDHQKLDTIKYLLSKGFDLSRNNGMYLKLAIEDADFTIVKYLIKQGLDIKIYGNIALKYAVRRQDIEIMQYLVRKGANVSLVDEKDLAHVRKSAWGHTIKFLAYYDIDVFNDGWTRYYELLKSGHLIKKPEYDWRKG